MNGFQTINDSVLGPGDEQVTEMAPDAEVPIDRSSSMGWGANGVMTWQHTNVWAGGGESGGALLASSGMLFSNGSALFRMFRIFASVAAAASLIYPALLVNSCSRSKPAPPQSSSRASVQSKPVRAYNSAKCLQEARKELGPSGTVLKCGYLIGDASLEAIIAVRVPGLSDDNNGIPISALRIVRKNDNQWDTQLNVDRETTNGFGYLGVNFIDDSYPFPYYRVNFTDSGAKWGDRSASQLTLVLVPMSRDGKVDPEDMGLGIGWNSAVSRFQEIEPSGDEFAPEVKAPKHIRSH